MTIDPPFPSLDELDRLADYYVQAAMPDDVGGATALLLTKHLRPLAQCLADSEILARIIGEATAKGVRDTYAGEVGVAVDVANLPIALEWHQLTDLERTVARYVAHRVLAELTGELGAGIEVPPGTVLVDEAQRLEAPIDLDGAVLLEDVTTTIGKTLAGLALAVRLVGRVNRTSDTSDVTYLTSPGGIVGVIANLIEVAARHDPNFAAHLVGAVTEALEQMP